MTILKDITLPFDKSVWMLLNAEKYVDLVDTVEMSAEIIDLAYEHDVTFVEESDINENIIQHIHNILYNALLGEQPTFILYNKVKSELFVMAIDYNDEMDEDDIDLNEISDYSLRRLPPSSKYRDIESNTNDEILFIDSSLNDANTNDFANIDREIAKCLSSGKKTIEEITNHIKDFWKNQSKKTPKFYIDQNFRLWTNEAKDTEIKIGSKPKCVLLWVLSYPDGIEKTALKENSAEYEKLWNIYRKLTGKGKGSFEQFVKILKGGDKKQDGFSYNITNINKAFDLAYHPNSAQIFHIRNINKKLNVEANANGLIEREDFFAEGVVLE